MLTAGMKDADEVMKEIFKGDFTPETIELLDNI